MPQPSKTGVAFLLSQIGTRSAQEFARLLAPLKLSPADAGILRLLRQTPGISQQQLAQTLGMHASRLVAIIDILESRKLLARTQNPEDRRLYSLHLTERGTETLAEIGNIARTHNDLMCSGLKAAEVDQLASLLHKIAAAQGLTPKVHPGYKDLKPAAHPRTKSRKPQP
ncbi:MAG TPA: MarR family transcriptional regulator [Acidobacteriaceae bacterium]|nr:MarR family transcriptional regulator [Acidobacteriaceae bacterium]